MQIWLECIKRIQLKNKVYTSPFIRLSNAKYLYSEVYLGAKSIVTFQSEGLVLSISYSVRDGILINIKQLHPYRILFDYVDGAYYINDDRTVSYHHLIEDLSRVKDQIKSLHYTEIFEKIERIMFDYVTNNNSKN